LSVNLGGFAGWGYSFPSSAQQGDFFYRVDLFAWYAYESGVWTLTSSGGGGITNLDGGSANSVYLITQNIDGGNALGM